MRELFLAHYFCNAFVTSRSDGRFCIISPREAALLVPRGAIVRRRAEMYVRGATGAFARGADESRGRIDDRQRDRIFDSATCQPSRDELSGRVCERDETRGTLVRRWSLSDRMGTAPAPTVFFSQINYNQVICLAYVA